MNEEDNSLDDFSEPLKLPIYPNKAGVYILTDKDGKILYVGSTGKLCRRISQLTMIFEVAHIKSRLLNKHQLDGNDVFVRFFETDDFKRVEKKLTKKYQPIWNKNNKK